MAPESLEARNVVGEAPEVEVEETPLRSVPANPTYPPFSVTLYRLEVE